ncbi:AAA family ATPase [Nonomuraea sp. NPDC052116]|uniref:ATP-binding protein n=1 Tax=Nonomuraea sp. NPDC052116 TaxID=3155665 RepID=UPI00343AF6C9
MGRRREMADVRRLLSGSRMVTLTGVGGVGKTRLAIRVGTTLRRAFPDGVWLVELADLRSPESLAAVVCEALQIRDRSARPALELLIDRLRDKQTLLILDNCEHLPADCAVMCDALLRSAPGLRILATSRKSLGIDSEQIVEVPPLTLPNAGTARADGSDAVQLFAERAQAAMPGFAVTDANREAVEGICRRLDCLPLGIELAAAHLRGLSVRQLLSRLDDRFRLSAFGSRAVLPRHQTLRALIDWSYALCTDAERALWARVSVFAGGLDLEAAEQVCAGDGIARADVLDLVAGLVDQSILIREEHPGHVRYRLLETIRQYGRERLTESGTETDFLRRHRDYFQDLAVRGEQEWFGPDQLAWFTRLRAEHGNIRAALEFCLWERSDAAARAGIPIVTSLPSYWLASGLLHEPRRWLDGLLAAASAPTPERAIGLCVNAWLAIVQSDLTKADELLAQGRVLADRLGDPMATAHAAFVSGHAMLLSGRDPGQAAAFFAGALDRYRSLGHREFTAKALCFQALSLSLLRRSDQAAALFEESQRMCEAHGDSWLMASLLAVYGVELWRQGDMSQGRRGTPEHPAQTAVQRPAGHRHQHRGPGVGRR